MIATQVNTSKFDTIWKAGIWSVVRASRSRVVVWVIDLASQEHGRRLAECLHSQYVGLGLADWVT